MGTFRKKPVEIEAKQFVDNESATEIIDWIHASNSALAPKYQCIDVDKCIDKKQTSNEAYLNHYILIPTLEGMMKADHEDWIIKGIQGEFYPCKPDIFIDSYEEIN